MFFVWYLVELNLLVLWMFFGSLLIGMNVVCVIGMMISCVM